MGACSRWRVDEFIRGSDFELTTRTVLNLKGDLVRRARAVGVDCGHDPFSDTYEESRTSYIDRYSTGRSP